VKIEALLFDLGKVIVDFNFDLGLERLAGRCGLPLEDFKKVLFDKAWIRPYERGEITTAEYHRHLCETGLLQMDLAEFRESWSAVFMPDLLIPESLLENLGERYPLILVSNSNESHVDYIERNYSVLEHFDVKIFSHVVGALKPDRRIYEAAIAAAGHPAEALFFTDDREENIRGAEEVGIRAHQFTTVPRLLESLRNHGVAVHESFR
jgi:HAD superfamily hydrolase (TIGR01509 family)